MRATGCAVVVALALMVGVSSGSAASFFTSPTRNIQCGYLGAGESEVGVAAVGCTTMNDDAAMFIAADGARWTTTWNVTDYGRVLRYGRSRSLGPFRCTSRYTGMTCVIRWSGRGFFISRDTWRWIR